MLSQVSSKTTKKSSKESVKGSTSPDSSKQTANNDATMALNIVRAPDSDLANAANAVYAEKKDPTGTSTGDVVAGISFDGFDEAATKRLIRKLDLHLIPFMALIYL